MAATSTRTAPFILEETYVRQDAHGRYSLNDLHAAAGGEARHRPNYWLDHQQTRALVGELKPALRLKLPEFRQFCRRAPRAPFR
jgi:KilA-N domain